MALKKELVTRDINVCASPDLHVTLKLCQQEDNHQVQPLDPGSELPTK